MEENMAKETGKTDSFHPVFAPMFSLGQTALEELDHQGERWLEYGASQVAESFRVARGVRSQLIGAASTMLATAGELAARSLDAAKSWTTPMGQVMASVANVAAPKA
ncbi:MAG TPA: hypothetical protein VF997_01890 [Polyangia bacterium]